VAPLELMAPHLRTILAPHVLLKLIDRCRLRPADHIERNGLVGVAAEALHLEIEVPGVQRVTQCRRRLRRAPENPACAYSTPHTRAYRLPCGPPWRALP
jgi:hypothetical protein